MVLSDSHGDLGSAHQILQEEKFDMILHLGDSIEDMKELEDCYDIPIEGVIGNVDYITEGEGLKLITLKGHKILMCHGHKFKVNQSIEYLVSYGLDCGADIILFGHTHTPVLLDRVPFVMNPGSIVSPRNVENPSYGILILEEKKINGEIIFIE